MATRTSVRRPGNKVQKHDDAAILAAVADLTADAVTGQVSQFRNSVLETAALLETGLQNQRAQFEKLTTAIALMEERLKELGVIEGEAVTIDEIRQRRIDEQEQHTKEMDKQRQQYDELMAELQQQFERRGAEIDYAVSLKQARAEDALQAMIAENKRNESIRQQDLQRSWSEREAALAEREDELAQLRDKVDGFDALLEAKVAEAVAKAVRDTEREHQHGLTMTQQRAASEVALLQQKLEAAEQDLRDVRGIVEAQRQEVIALRNDNKEVTKAALEAQSGQQALRAVQQQNSGVGEAKRAR